MTDSLCDLAEARFKEGLELGKDPEPWNDGERDFKQEAIEELADAFNYLSWKIKRKDIVTDEYRKLMNARECVIDAFIQLKMIGG